MTQMKATRGYIEPEGRSAYLPPVRTDGPLSFGVPPDPAGAYVACPFCYHPSAWRIAPGSIEYECSHVSPQGRSCHSAGKRFSAFPAVPEPDAAA